MPEPDLIPLARVARELLAGGFTSKPVDYARVYRAVLSGAIPSEQVTSNRWSVRRADLAVVASALGLTPATAAGEASSSRRNASPVASAAA